MKEIQKQETMRTKYKYIEHDSNKPRSMREKGTDKYENAHIQIITITFFCFKNVR